MSKGLDEGTILVYRLLTRHLAQADIARYLKKPPMYVSRRAQKLVKNKYLRKVRGTSHPAIYKATGKALPGADLVDHRGMVDGNPCIAFRGHQFAVKYPVLEPPRKPWPFIGWDKESNPSGVPMKFIEDIKLDTDEGPIIVKCIRYIEGKEKSSITIWPEDIDVVNEAQMEDIELYITKEANLAAKALKDMVEMRLGPGEFQQSFHLGTQISPEIVKAALDYGLTGGDTWFDRSTGSGEWETDDVPNAIIMMQAPTIIRDHEARLRRMEEALHLTDLDEDGKT